MKELEKEYERRRRKNGVTNAIRKQDPSYFTMSPHLLT
jgi:hypothetical protein